MENTLEKSLLKYLDYCASTRAARKYHEILKNERSNLTRKAIRR